MTDIEVHVGDRGETVLAGTAHFTRNRGRVTTTFTYAPGYLARPGAASIDPNLQLVSGSQYEARLLGAFADSAPDRWGRNVITKRERELAREGRRAARSLDDVDFLLGVSDTTRQGALRFRAPGTQGFDGLLALASDCDLSAAEARDHLARIVTVAGEWRAAAARNRLADREQTRMADAIELRLDGLRRAAAAIPAAVVGPDEATGSDATGEGGPQSRDRRGRFGSRK